MLDEGQQTEVITNRNEELPEQNIRIPTRTRTESKRLAGYERFLDQAVDEDAELIEEVMMMFESELIDLDQAINDLTGWHTCKKNSWKLRRIRPESLSKRKSISQLV